MINFWDNLTRGKKRKEIFLSLGLESAEDFFYFTPQSYQDWKKIIKIRELEIGLPVTVIAKVVQIQPVFGKRRFVKALITDGTGLMYVYWFQALHILKSIHLDETYAWHGIPRIVGKNKALAHPSYELADKKLRVGKINPIYPKIVGFNSIYWQNAWNQLSKDFIIKINWPKKADKILAKAELKIVSTANEWLKLLHNPDNEEDIYLGRKYQTLTELVARKLYREINQPKQKGIKFSVNKIEQKNILTSYPFTLTESQEESIQEIKEDLASGKIMRRILQGDVGSGKTAVASYAGAIVCKEGYDVYILVPTNLLAEQHFRTIGNWWTKANLGNIELVTSVRRERIENDKSKGTIYIGTTALLTKNPSSKLGLVIIDEQHRFGVKQRERITSEHHLLSLTATPIPRTVALMAMGNLSYSRLKTKPGNRKQIITKIISDSKAEKSTWEYCKKRIEKGEKIFIVCPAIETEEDNKELDIASVESVFSMIKKEFKNNRVDMVHGKMKKDKQEEVLAGFASDKADILVATTVLEVGIDIPQATVMIIMASERFGLATLHQLRGRVGRNDLQSYCLLRPTEFSHSTNPRLKAMTQIYDGQELAEKDYSLRGGGSIFGTQQSGIIQDFTFPDLLKKDLLDCANELSEEIIKDKKGDYGWWLNRKTLSTVHQE